MFENKSFYSNIDITFILQALKQPQSLTIKLKRCAKQCQTCHDAIITRHNALFASICSILESISHPIWSKISITKASSYLRRFVIVLLSRPLIMAIANYFAHLFADANKISVVLWYDMISPKVFGLSASKTIRLLNFDARSANFIIRKLKAFCSRHSPTDKHINN